MQVRLLPGARPLVAGIPALLGEELGTVYDPPSCPVDLGRMDLVEHLVEYDHLHEVAGDPPVIGGGRDADDLLVMEVHAHLDRAAPAGRAPPAPPDPGAHGAIEVARVQDGVDVAQIVHAAARGQRSLWPRRRRFDQLAVLADVLVDGAAVGAPVAAGEGSERAPPPLRGAL